ncbi:MAG: ABC transporter substrate-binding protein [Myxococcales bacterium]|nr:ABC transporter substrate-binding protein [Myxococcales bacterium]
MNLVIVVCIALHMVPASSTATAAPTTVAEDRPSPRRWLESRVRQGHKLASRKVEPDTLGEQKWQAQAKKLIDDILDWNELTRRSLGSNWRKRSAKEQQTFSHLLRQLIEVSYRSRLRYAVREDALDKKEDVNIEWLEEDVRASKANLVAKVTANRNSALLGFNLLWTQGRWRVYDVAIDDLSTVRTYRSNFRKILKTEGWEGLINRLQNKIADIEAGRADFARPNSLGSRKAPEHR